MTQHFSRNIRFEEILNFRDLGGYKARGGRTIAWRRLFRSGEMHLMTGHDATRLKEEIKLKTVIDLRSATRLEKTGVGRLNEIDVIFHSLPLSIITEGDIEKKVLEGFSNSAEIYLFRIRDKEYGRSIIDALEIIAAPENYPLVFHCNAGKDRSGIIAAILLSALGITEEDIVNDYVLTAQSLKQFIERWDNDPETAHIHRQLPDFQKQARPEEMRLFLAGIRNKYGSAEGYLKTMGAEKSLTERLEKALLV
jgi:protein-tyrosine phosphatase